MMNTVLVVAVSVAAALFGDWVASPETRRCRRAAKRARRVAVLRTARHPQRDEQLAHLHKVLGEYRAREIFAASHNLKNELSDARAGISQTLREIGKLE